MRRPGLRRCWLVLHRWVGLSFGCLLILAAVTGSLLVLARPLDEALHPELFRTGGGASGPVQPVVSRLRAEFGPDAAFNIRLPPRPDQSLQVAVNGRWNGTVYFNAASGREIGRRATAQGFFNTLFELHSTLHAGESGRAMLAWAALAYGAMLMSGLVLWWPVRWGHAFTVRTGSGPTVTLRDLHRVAGAALGLLVTVAVLTGAYMAWRPVAGWVTYLSGRTPATLPAPKGTPHPATATATIDTAIQRSKQHWPDAMVSVVHVPPGSVAATRVRLRLADDPHPIGMSTAWLDPVSGGVRTARRWSELEAGSRAFSFVYPLHTGALSGILTLLATFTAGVALAVFGCTGVWLWWQRRWRPPAR